jgi:hypothetical protein
MKISKLFNISFVDAILILHFAFCNLHFPYSVIMPENPRNARAISPVRTNEMGNP